MKYISLLLFAATCLFAHASEAVGFRTELPTIEPKPDTSGLNYTFANLQRLADWEVKYGVPCLIVFPANIDRPVYIFGGSGSASSFIIVPMSSLLLYERAIKSGEARWMPLSEAYELLSRPVAPAQPVPPTVLEENLKRAIEVIDAAKKALDSF